MHIIFFPLLWVHFVAAIGDSKAGLAGYKPYIKPGIIGYTCQTNNQGTVEVNLQEIKAAHNSACNLSKQKGRFTNFPTKFIPFQGQSLDFFSEKYYINPASFVKYRELNPLLMNWWNHILILNCICSWSFHHYDPRMYASRDGDCDKRHKWTSKIALRQSYRKQIYQLFGIEEKPYFFKETTRSRYRSSIMSKDIRPNLSRSKRWIKEKSYAQQK